MAGFLSTAAKRLRPHPDNMENHPDLILMNAASLQRVSKNGHLRAMPVAILRDAP